MYFKFNYEVRKLMHDLDVKYYEVAKKMGKSRTTLSHYLSRELYDFQKKELIDIIKEIAREKNGE